MRLLVLVVLTLSAWGQELPNPVTAGDFFNISGLVIDATTTQPVPRAQVSLAPIEPVNSGTQRSTRSDPSGGFNLPHVPVGTYELRATKIGYASGENSLRKLILVSGTQPDRFTLMLEPQAVLGGTVTDQDGDPVAGAEVQVLVPEIVWGLRRLRSRETVKTNDRGVFRFSGLGSGRYYVCVIPKADPADLEDGSNYSPTFFPNTTDVSSAPAIDLQSGSEQQFNVQVRLQDAFHIRGRLTPPGTASVGLRLADPGTYIFPAVAVQVNRQTGEFDIGGVPSGTYRVMAFSGPRNRVSADPLVTVSGDVSGTDVQVMESAVVTGRIHVEGGDSAKDVAKAVWLRDQTGGSSSPVGPDGLFSISSPSPGNLRIGADLDPNWYISSVTQAGVDVLHSGLTIGEGAAAQPVDITVKPNAAIIEAVVNWPATGLRRPARVTVLEEGNGRNNVVAEAMVIAPNAPLTARTAVINGLAPGRYAVYAWLEPLKLLRHTRAHARRSKFRKMRRCG
jgi:hypothetical protein